MRQGGRAACGRLGSCSLGRALAPANTARCVMSARNRLVLFVAGTAGSLFSFLFNQERHSPLCLVAQAQTRFADECPQGVRGGEERCGNLVIQYLCRMYSRGAAILSYSICL